MILLLNEKVYSVIIIYLLLSWLTNIFVYIYILKKQKQNILFW